MELFGKFCRLRAYRADEADALCAVAGDYSVARWMTQRFPHPYTRADADEHFAIEVDSALAGGIGINEGSVCDGLMYGRVCERPRA